MRKQTIFNTESWPDKTIGETIPRLITTRLIAYSEVSIAGILIQCNSQNHSKIFSQQ